MAEKRVVLVTGANSGIGYETVKALLTSSRAYHVLLGSRDPSKGSNAMEKLAKEVPVTESTLECIQIDIQDDHSIKAAVEAVEGKFAKLDVLVNNAGTAFDFLFDQDAPNFRSIMNKTFDLNTTSANVVTYMFAPLLLRSADPRLIFNTSGTSNLADSHETLIPGLPPAPTGWPKKGLALGQSYRCSKTALNMLMLTWHYLLKGDGVKVWCISPGFLATDGLGIPAEAKRARGAKEPHIGGELMRNIIEGGKDEHVGKVVGQDDIIQNW